MPYRGHSHRLHCPPIHNKNIYKLFICSRSLWQKRGPLMTTYGLISLAFDFPELRKMIHHCQTQPQESEPLAAGYKNNQNSFREKKGGHVLVSREIPFTQKKNFTSLHRYFQEIYNVCPWIFYVAVSRAQTRSIASFCGKR